MKTFYAFEIYLCQHMLYIVIAVMKPKSIWHYAMWRNILLAKIALAKARNHSLITRLWWGVAVWSDKQQNGLKYFFAEIYRMSNSFCRYWSRCLYDRYESFPRTKIFFRSYLLHYVFYELLPVAWSKCDKYMSTVL